MKSGARSADSLRIIWAVAAKDIVDAIRSKTMLGIIAGVVILVGSAMVLPLLTGSDDVARLAVHDPGRSELVEQIRRERKVRLYKMPTQEAMLRFVSEGSGPMLGLDVPANVDDLLHEAGPVTLTGYYLHWVAETGIILARSQAETYLSQLSGSDVRIDIAGNEVYPAADADGAPYMMALRTMVAVITICLAMVPHLMIEEKESHTMDALLVSPASVFEITVGKGLAGLLYGVTAGLVGYAISAATIVSWPAAIAAIAAGGLLAVSLGLLMGTLTENPQQLGAVMGVPMALLLVPSFLYQLGTDGWPRLLVGTVRWFPSVTMIRLVQMSLAERVDPGSFLLDMAAIAVPTAAFFALVARQLRRQGR